MSEPVGASVTLDLLRKYDRPGPRYTSYPTAMEFTSRHTATDYREKLREADVAGDEPLSFYVHLPFCMRRCTFCACHVVVTHKHDVSARYLEYLHREIDLLAEHLPHRRRISQYHWGGGTPTYQTVLEMESLHRKVIEHFHIESDAEVAIEVDPRHTSFEQIDLLKELGFNRISMGVQDFNPEVQAAINRNQTEEQTRRLYAYCRERDFHSINLDLIYGLPLQTAVRFERNVDAVLGLRPDRVALYSYAYVPWVRANQKRIDVSQLPPPDVKLRLFYIARQKFLGAGYEQIGMDHFALPGDELAKAVHDRRLHRNFMGYTVKMGTDMVGVGISAIDDIRGAYIQNAKKLTTYYRALEEGRFPVERGYVLDEDDRIRRTIIMKLMCNFHLDRTEIEEAFSIDFERYFAAEMTELLAPGGPVEQGFLEILPKGLEVVGAGRLFIRNLCMVFDKYLRSGDDTKPVFSRTV